MKRQPLRPLKELVGQDRSKRSDITKHYDWNPKGYWMLKNDQEFRRAPGKFCGDCVTEMTEVRKSKSASSHLKCEDCGKTIGKRESIEA